MVCDNLYNDVIINLDEEKLYKDIYKFYEGIE